MLVQTVFLMCYHFIDFIKVKFGQFSHIKTQKLKETVEILHVINVKTETHTDKVAAFTLWFLQQFN